MSNPSHFQFRWFIVPAIQLDERAAELNRLLPQHQCRQCHEPDCAHYAQALAQGSVPADRCTPGGTAVTTALRQRLDDDDARIAPLSLSRSVVVIAAAQCIGCTRCLQACPLDALIGAAKRLHAVLPDLCSGCGLCIEVCPVDCMQFVAYPKPWTAADADAASLRHTRRQQRLSKKLQDKSEKKVDEAAAQRKSAIEAALAKARARRRAEDRGQKTEDG